MLLTAEPDAARVEANLFFSGGGTPQAGQLWLQVNHVPVGPARAIESVGSPDKAVRQASLHRTGAGPARRVTSSSCATKGEALTVLSIDLSVNP